MIGSFDDDDVGHEVGPEQETQASDVVRFLRSAARQTQLSELLVGAQHYQVGTKNYPVDKIQFHSTMQFDELKDFDWC